MITATVTKAPTPISLEEYNSQRIKWTLYTLISGLAVLGLSIFASAIPIGMFARPIAALCALLVLGFGCFCYIQRMTLSGATDFQFTSWLELARKALPDVEAFAAEVRRQGRPITKLESVLLENHYTRARSPTPWTQLFLLAAAESATF